MEKKINIAELLKNCPKGMELDCLLWDNVTFESVADGGIWIKRIDSKDGEHSLYVYNDGSFPIHNISPLRTKCVIYPKGKTTWEGFVPPCKFKDGDVVINKNYAGNWIGIFHNHCCEKDTFSCHCYLRRDGTFSNVSNTHEYFNTCLATEEEKQKLFDAIKENGYRWNDETKTLEKIEPKFKVGDKIKKIGTNVMHIILNVFENHYVHDGGAFNFAFQNEYELVPNKFDINTLVPFESKVLVRDSNREKWKSNFWGFYDSEHEMNYPYECCGASFAQCIPYEGNEHLLGTTNNCDEYYKTW